MKFLFLLVLFSANVFAKYEGLPMKESDDSFDYYFSIVEKGKVIMNKKIIKDHDINFEKNTLGRSLDLKEVYYAIEPNIRYKSILYLESNKELTVKCVKGTNNGGLQGKTIPFTSKKGDKITFILTCFEKGTK